MKKNIQLFAFMAFLSLFFSACFSYLSKSILETVHARVDTYGNLTVHGKRYFLDPKHKSQFENELQYQELVSYVHKMMKIKGFYPVEEQNLANFELKIDYSFGYGEKRTNTSQNAIDGITGYTEEVKKDATTGVETKVVTPSYGTVGYSSTVNDYVVFPRNIKLFAFANKNMVWAIEIFSESGRDDIRNDFPAMIYAAKNYWEKSTNGKINVSFKNNTPDYQAFRFGN